MILFNKLFALVEARGHAPTYWLRQNGIHPAVVNKMRKNEQVNTGTINQLCALLDCQPGDIMEYIPDAENKGNKNGPKGFRGHTDGEKPPKNPL